MFSMQAWRPKAAQLAGAGSQQKRTDQDRRSHPRCHCSSPSPIYRGEPAPVAIAISRTRTLLRCGAWTVEWRGPAVRGLACMRPAALFSDRRSEFNMALEGREECSYIWRPRRQRCASRSGMCLQRLERWPAMIHSQAHKQAACIGIRQTSVRQRGTVENSQRGGGMQQRPGAAQSMHSADAYM